MLKVLTWVVSNDMSCFNKTLDILDRQHDGLKSVGVKMGEEIAEVGGRDYDVLLVVGARRIGMNGITKAAQRLNLPEEKLLGDWIVCISGFTLEKYRELQSSCLSIFSRNCFGGLISHTLGLPFRSPFVNMFLDEKKFLRLIQNLKALMEKNLLLKETKWNEDLNFQYPVVTLGDVVIHMNHYKDFDEAAAKWNERKQRINWDNLFVTMYTEDEKILRAFDELPYEKKICFVPFKSDLDSAWQINTESQKGIEFWRSINAFAEGTQLYYDPFDMLLYGKKTQLIEM